MKKLVLAIILALTFSMSAQIAKDKRQHLLAGFLITLAVSEVSYQITDNTDLSLGIGLGTGVLAGIGKELVWDKAMKKGYPSVDDAIFTTAGSLCGMFTICIKLDIQKRKNKKFGDRQRPSYIYNE